MPDEDKVEARGQEVSSSLEAEQEAAIAGVQAAVSDHIIVKVSLSFPPPGAESRGQGGQLGGGAGPGRHLHREAVAAQGEQRDGERDRGHHREPAGEERILAILTKSYLRCIFRA